MKYKRDYLYEYSDLNLFQTRVVILTGKYKDVILEFGGSYLIQSPNVQDFTFEYTLYAKPESYTKPLIGDPKFVKFLSKLLISITNHRNNSSDAKSLLDEAASVDGIINTKIKIDDKFYGPNVKTNYAMLDF